MGVKKNVIHTETDTRQISFFVPSALYSALRHAAIAEDRPYGALIQEILISDERVSRWLKGASDAEIRE